MAKILNYNQGKMNSILKDLYYKLIDSFSDHPPIIRKTVHFLHVCRYLGDEDHINKEWREEQWKKAMTIPIVIPVMPRIGEYVEISFGNTMVGF